MTRIASIRRHHNERSVFWGKLISQSLTRSHERQEARPALECEDRLANDIFIHCKAKTEHAIWDKQHFDLAPYSDYERLSYAEIIYISNLEH